MLCTESPTRLRYGHMVYELGYEQTTIWQWVRPICVNKTQETNNVNKH